MKWMVLFFQYLIGACTFWIPIGCGMSDAAVPPGFLEGQLKIVFPWAVEPSDNMPRSAVAPETYAEYPLVVLSQSDKKEVARVTPNEQGNYRVSLPPGAYILDVEGRVAKRLRARPQEFTVNSNETVRLDMSIIIGFRSGVGLFIGLQEDVYAGMIVGENARPEDLPVNPCRRNISPTCAPRAKVKPFSYARVSERTRRH